MKLIIDIPEQMYLNAKANMLCGAGVIARAIKNGTPLPENATNGDVMKAMFPQIEVEHNNSGIHDLMNVYNLDSNKAQFPTPLFTNWWNAPYKAESEDEDADGD